MWKIINETLTQNYLHISKEPPRLMPAVRLSSERKVIMNKRPTSISVIAWVLIVMGGISLIATTIMMNNHTARDMMAKSLLPIPVQYAISYIGLLVTIVSGAAMLKGINWARYLYVFWTIAGFFIGITTSPFKAAMIPGFILFLVVAFFLFRPKANSFFVSFEENGHA